MEWQPIETAPIHAETVLLWWNKGTKIGWRQYSGKWVTPYRYEPVSQPTHWMPLPEPPDLPSIEEMSGSIHPDCEIFETRKDRGNA